MDKNEIRQILKKNVEQIAKMRQTLMPIGASSIAGEVSVGIWKDGVVKIGYTQSGSSDGGMNHYVFETRFGRLDIFDNLDDVYYNEKEGCFMDNNGEKFTEEDLLEMTLDWAVDQTLNDIDLIPEEELGE